MADRYQVMFVGDARAAGIIGADQERDYCWLLIEYDGDKPARIVATDGGEPEDQLLVRDWSWVAPELNYLAARIAELEVENAKLRGEQP